MEKKELNEEISNLFIEIDEIKKKKKKEIESLESEQVNPLLDEVNRLKREIEESVSNKYKDEMDALILKKKNLSQDLESLKVKEAKEIWYAEGTKVYLWRDISSRWSGKRDVQRTGQTGTVCVYDGTQPLSVQSRYSFPDKGDVIVILHKKDGSLGLKYEVIFSYGNKKRGASEWYSEEDTPDDNLLKRKEKLEENN